MDIDAVSLLTFTLDKGGIFLGHSPYYNLESEELQRASELLPFPSGESLEVLEEGSTIEKYTNEFRIQEKEDFEAENDVLSGLLRTDIEKLLNDTIFKVLFKKNGEVKLFLDLDTPLKIKRFSKFLSENSKQYGKINPITFAREFLNATGESITEELAESLDKQLIDIINRHNLYINKSSVNKRTGISRNYITQQSYDLIIDPINLQQAQSSVDGITGTAKDLAKQSLRAAVLDTFTPHNAVNKVLSIAENMVGKDGIAVCATGLKSFFAITQMWNQILSSSDIQAKEDLMFEVEIGGYTYKGLANVFSEKLLTDEIKSLIDGTNMSDAEIELRDQLFTNKIMDYLVDLFYALDASNEKSAMLSLSTDNAKELVLNKINASTATLGMYIYGLSIGVPFKTLYNIINSPLGVRLNELTKGNYFNSDSGTRDIVGALDYILREPIEQLAKFDNIEYEGETLPSPTELFLGNYDLRALIKLEIASKHGEEARKALRAVLDRIEKARNKFNTLHIVSPSVKEQYEILYNLLIDFALQYAEDVALAESNQFYSTIYGEGSLIKDFEKLALGAAEMKAIGKILKLNQGIDTKPSELINLVDRISDVLIKRISLIRRQNKRGKTSIQKEEALNEKDMTEFVNMIKSHTYKSDYKIDFSRFMTDNEYAENMIHKYDLVKVSYNPLKILHAVKHFKGYAETLYIDYETGKRKASKFKLIADYKSKLEQEWNVFDPKMKELLATNIENQVDTYYRQLWMKSRYSKKKPTMPASTLDRPVAAFIDSSANARPVLFDRELQLGTVLGDANFKILMEDVIIPDMKRKYPNNKFILALSYTVNPKTTFGTISANYSLQIDMMPRSDYDKEVFREYKKAFNELSKEDLYLDIKGTLWSPQELLYMYSLITNNGRISPNSLHGIFEDYVNSAVAKDFYTTISKYDNSDLAYQEMFKHIETYQIDLLPYSTPYRGGADKFRQFNKETEEVVVWEDKHFSDEELQGMDPQELRSMIGGYSSNKPYPSGFNTNFFLNGVRSTDLETVNTLDKLIDISKYPELSKYNIEVQQLSDGIGIINILANTAEESEKAKLFMEYILKNNKGKIREKTVISKKKGAEKFIDLESLNDELANIKCLSV